ncbi:hypothetical protein Dsin_018571 [Dipteronia sinensis]|uniref:Uncharacterized protein n=1 Tax=Dipteronia sinensis TaxID=43782 RepID=A0AAE0A5J4_9ROSI|nr:hypothetical protein Dsin_018571 [Dipteronia sinensis]
MEGLIPMVFKAIKKNKTRRQYECLSSGAPQSYNIADFYVNTTTIHSADKAEERYATHHRRHKSVGDFYVGYSSSANGGGVGSPPPVPQKLVRFRSQRMFSCITGA